MYPDKKLFTCFYKFRNQSQELQMRFQTLFIKNIDFFQLFIILEPVLRSNPNHFQRLTEKYHHNSKCTIKTSRSNELQSCCRMITNMNVHITASKFICKKQKQEPWNREPEIKDLATPSPHFHRNSDFSSLVEGVIQTSHIFSKSEEQTKHSYLLRLFG